MSYDLATFYNRTRNARKIIVVDLGFLGDTVHLIPAGHSGLTWRRDRPVAA